MFPRLRQRFGTAALDSLDLLVELSTLGEYGLAEDGLPLALGRSREPHTRGPRVRDDCPLRGSPTLRRCSPSGS